MRVFDNKSTPGLSVQFGSSETTQVAFAFSVDGVGDVSATVTLQVLKGAAWSDVISKSVFGSMREIGGAFSLVEGDSYRLNLSAVVGFVTANVSTLGATADSFSDEVRSTLLTGLNIGEATAITAADSVLSALGKLQAQASAGGGGGGQGSIAIRLPPNYGYAAGATGSTATTVTMTVNRIYFIPVVFAKSVDVASVGINVTTPVAGALQVGVYDSDGQPAYDSPGTLLASAEFDVTTTGNKSTSMSVRLTAGKTYFVAATSGVAVSISGIAAATSAPSLGSVYGNIIANHYILAGSGVLPNTVVGSTAAPTGSVIPCAVLRGSV